MELTQLAYVCFFLPLSIVLYYLTFRRGRPVTLAVLSVVFLLFVSPVLALCATVATLGCYLCAVHIYRSRFSLVRRRIGLFAGLVLCMGIFSAYIWREGMAARGAIMLATVILGAFSYLMDLYRGEDNHLHPFGSFAAYCLFFGKLVYGPLVRADEFIAQLPRVRASAREMGRGIFTFFIGLAQLLILADSLHIVENYISEAPIQSLLTLAMRTLIIGLGWYFLLSGYSNIAQGTGLLFGIDLPRNHAYPFGATSFGSYFGRFLITQNSYARTYLAPLLGGGERVGSGNILAVAATAAFAGLWIGFPGGAVWGGAFGLLIWAERLMPGGRGRFDGLRRTVVFAVGAVSFCLLLPDNGLGYVAELGAMFADLGSLPFYTELSFYMLIYFLPLVLLSLLLATRLIQGISSFLKSKQPLVYSSAVFLWGLGLMTICLSAMIHKGGWPAL